jgi:predicted negative regulator of RcsB-dependent stress response
MASYDLEEQEQIAELKAWWKQYGNLVSGVITVAALAAVTWQGWNWYQRQQSAQAAVVFAGLQKAIASNDTQRIKAASGELVDKYGGTAYAPLAALKTARALIDAGDARTARVQLAWVVEQGKDELRDVARLRLAALLLDEKAHDEALKLLEATPAAGFAVRFADARGDVLVAQGKPGEARAAYRSALSGLDAADGSGQGRNSLQDSQANAAYRAALQLKLDGLGEPG